MAHAFYLQRMNSAKAKNIKIFYLMNRQKGQYIEKGGIYGQRGHDYK